MKKMKCKDGFFETALSINLLTQQHALLCFESFEYSLFYLEDFTFRAAPGVRKILKRGAGRNPRFGISFFRIIDIVAFKTDPSMHVYSINHFVHHLLDFLGKIIFFP